MRYNIFNQIHKAIQQFEPSLKEAFEQEHVQDHALVQRLTVLMNAYENAVSTTERTLVALAIHTAFVDAPEPVFRALFNIASSELSPQRWRWIQEVLMEGVLVA